MKDVLQVLGALKLTGRSIDQSLPDDRLVQAAYYYSASAYCPIPSTSTFGSYLNIMLSHAGYWNDVGFGHCSLNPWHDSRSLIDPDTMARNALICYSQTASIQCISGHAAFRRRRDASEGPAD